MTDANLEIVDTVARETYNKIVIHKKKWIPVNEVTDDFIENNYEKDKQSHADDDLTVVKLPRLLKIQDTQMKNNLKPALPPKPAVPPKPVLYKNLGHSIPGRHVGKMVNDTNMIRSNRAWNNGDSCAIIANIRTQSTKSQSETNEAGNKPKRDRESNLCNEKHELLERMKKKIKILEEDKQEIEGELIENEQDLNRIVAMVEDHGSIVDADKLKVHIKELESVTRLKTVLTVREESAETKIKITTDASEKVNQYIFVISGIKTENCINGRPQHKIMDHSFIFPDHIYLVSSFFYESHLLYKKGAPGKKN